MNRIAAVVAGLSLAFVGTTNTVLADWLYVGTGDGDYATLSAAVEAASDGDTIQIWPGNYGFVGTITVDKDITIQGCTTCDASKTIIGVGGLQIEANVLIQRLSFSGSGTGTAITCVDFPASIQGCILSDYGTGIICGDSTAISGCEIRDNGTGIMCFNSKATISDCNILENNTGIHSCSSDPLISHCTIVENIFANVVNDDLCLLRGEEAPGIITLENCTICGTGEHVSGLIVHVGENHISDCIDDGDLDGDGDVDVDDLNVLHSMTGVCRHDTDHNGITDIDDLLNLIEGWGDTCSP